MEIVKYEIIDKVIDKKRPFFDKERGLFIFRVNPKYRYYLQCKQYNPQQCEYDYFLLMGLTMFNENCKQCRRDDFGRYKIRLTKELKDYIIEASADNANFDLIYVESTELYDVWQIN